MRRIRTSWLVVLVALAWMIGAGAGGGGRIALASTDFVWERYDVTLGLLPDGSVRVNERQEVVFGPGFFHEGYAEIPMERIDTVEDVIVREESPTGVVTLD